MLKYKLYKYLRYNPLLQYLPYEDVMQELSIVEFLYSDFKKARRAAVNAIYRLSVDLGFSRKKGKDNFQPFYAEKAELSGEEKALLDNIEYLYLDKDLTAREIATIYSCEYNNNFQKVLHNLFPKGKGRGGKRKNSGRKKMKKNDKEKFQRNNKIKRRYQKTG